jgi:protein-S-isoprenylcysteine O-methyltransferase Ste14
MSETKYRISAFALLAINVSMSGYFRHRADGRGGTLRTPEGKGTVVVLRLLALAVVLPLLGYLIKPRWVAWARVQLPGWLRALGLAGAVGTVPLFYATLNALGDNISPTQATRHGHRLITHGPYRWVRHPLYSGGLVLAFSLALLTSIWWLAVGLIAPVTVLLLRTRREEDHLVGEFGDEYRAYQARTRRFIPFLY